MKTIEKRIDISGHFYTTIRYGLANNQPFITIDQDHSHDVMEFTGDDEIETLLHNLREICIEIEEMRTCA